MTADHPVRRFLARVCSADTMSRVVDPTLADMRFERGRPAWSGYLALARALTVHAIASAPSRARRLWSEDERAMPKAVLACAATALAATLALAVPPLLEARVPQRIGIVRSFVLVAPQAMALALPASLLLGIPLVFRRTRARRRILVRSLAIGCVCAAGTLAALTIMPDANQAFRVETSGVTNIPRGTNELGFRALRERIDVLELTPGGQRAARPLRYHYQLRLALACAALPLGLLAGGIAGRRFGWAPSLAIGIAAIVGYTYALFAAERVASRLLVRAPAMPAGPIAWLPTIMLLVLTVIVWRASDRHAIETA